MRTMEWQGDEVCVIVEDFRCKVFLGNAVVQVARCRGATGQIGVGGIAPSLPPQRIDF